MCSQKECPTKFETRWLQEIPFSKELTDNYCAQGLLFESIICNNNNNNNNNIEYLYFTFFYRATRLHELQLNFDLSIISSLQISTRFLDFTRYSLSPIKLKFAMAQHDTDLIVYIINTFNYKFNWQSNLIETDINRPTEMSNMLFLCHDINNGRITRTGKHVLWILWCT